MTDLTDNHPCSPFVARSLLALLLAIFVVLRYMLYKLEAKMGMHSETSVFKAATDPLPMLNVGPKIHLTRPLAQRTATKEADDLRREVLARPHLDGRDERSGSFEAARSRKSSGRPIKHRPASLADVTWTKRPSNLSLHSATATTRTTSPHAYSPIRSTVRTGILSPLSPRSSKSACKSPLLASARLQSPVLLAIEEGFKTLKSPRSPRRFNALISAVLASENSGVSSALRSPKTPKRMARTYDEGFDAGLDEGMQERKPLMSPVRQF